MTRPTLRLLLSRLAFSLMAVLPTPAQTSPDPFQTHLQAGQADLRTGLPGLAVREYRAAVRLRPADAEAHYTLAGVLEAAGRTEEARAEYQNVIDLRPDNAPAHNALAGLLEDRGEWAAALAQRRQASALLPSDPHLRFNLGATLADMGRPAEAAAQYREALRLKPDFAEAAQALRVLGPILPVKSPLAVPLPPLAPSLKKDAPSEIQRGVTLARAGRLPEAIAVFHGLLSQDPRNAAARLHLGIVLYADGQKAAARREWEQVQTTGVPGASAQARRLLTRYP